MTDDEALALGRAWTDETPWAVLTALTELDHRLAGHEGERCIEPVGQQGLFG